MLNPTQVGTQHSVSLDIQSYVPKTVTDLSGLQSSSYNLMD